jgi:diguanylate cyclase (GGDEF)-like protein
MRLFSAFFERLKGRSLFIRKLSDFFLRMNIAKKLLLGYMSLALLIITISVFSLYNLERLNKINTSILNVDVPIIEATDNMIDNLLAQELYARRYVILKSPDMLDIFWKRSEEFDSLIKKINELPLEKDTSLGQLIVLHEEYNNILTLGISQLGRSSSSFSEKQEKMIKDKQNEIVRLIKELSEDARLALHKKTHMTSQIGTTAFKFIAFFCGIAVIMGIITAMIITRNIAGSINLLKVATEKISERKFDDAPKVNKRDELGDLSIAFDEMAKRLQALEKMDLDASPLTRLPGGVAIEKVLTKKLASGELLAFCLVDIDNFKAYNDRYGHARGNDLIKSTALIIKQSVAIHGADEDFVGHIGGDDFVIITDPERSSEICNAIIEVFDKNIHEFYDIEDIRRGHIISKSRSGENITSSISTLSIAIVTNSKRKLHNHIHVGEIAAELKEYAKLIPGSLYVIDQRREGSQKSEKTSAKIVKFPKT